MFVYFATGVGFLLSLVYPLVEGSSLDIPVWLGIPCLVCIFVYACVDLHHIRQHPPKPSRNEPNPSKNA